MIYKVETIKDGTEKYFFIRNLETMSIEELPSKYLMHKIKCKRSPNTVKRTAFSICYYMKYMAEKEMELTEVYQLDYEKQTEHFVDFLYWLKAGNHTEQTAGEKKCPNEGTCNAYLKDVFRFYLFIEAEYEQYGSLKTLSYNQIIAVNQVGVKKVLRNHSFKAYLKEEADKINAVQVANLDKKAIGALRAYAKSGKAPGQFIEVMACEGGCITGPCSHNEITAGKRQLTQELAKRKETY